MLVIVIMVMVLVMVLLSILIVVMIPVVMILILELTRPSGRSENTTIDDAISNDVGGSNDWLY